MKRHMGAPHPKTGLPLCRSRKIGETVTYVAKTVDCKRCLVLMIERALALGEAPGDIMIAKGDELDALAAVLGTVRSPGISDQVLRDHLVDWVLK